MICNVRIYAHAYIYMSIYTYRHSIHTYTTAIFPELSSVVQVLPSLCPVQVLPSLCIDGRCKRPLVPEDQGVWPPFQGLLPPQRFCSHTNWHSAVNTTLCSMRQNSLEPTLASQLCSTCQLMVLLSSCHMPPLSLLLQTPKKDHRQEHTGVSFVSLFYSLPCT